jgi:LemA protein
MKRLLYLSFIALIGSTLLSSCSYNKIVGQDEGVNEAWANVQASYQERFDLVGNLVETVKAYADFEQETLIGVIEARSKASGVQLNADQITPENLAKFEEAQSALSGSLSRLLVTVERYPELKANEQFKDLMAQLSRLEQKINISRRDYNAAVKTYNTTIRSFPALISAKIFGFDAKEPFKADAGAEKAPQVKF